MQAPAFDLPAADKPVVGSHFDEIRNVINAGKSTQKANGARRSVSLEYSKNVTQSTHPRGVRQYLRADEGTGYWDFIFLRKGFFLTLTDTHYTHPIEISLPQEPLIKIRAILTGKIIDHSGETILDDANACVHSLSGRKSFHYTIHADDTRLRMIVLHCQKSFIQNLPLDPAKLGDPFRSAIDTGHFDDLIMDFSSPAKILLLAKDMYESQKYLYQDLWTLHATAKAEEMLYHAIYKTMPLPEFFTGANRIRQNDIVKIHEARKIITSSLAAVPTVAEMSKLLGINSTKLRLGFREVFGESISTYVTRIKLQQAVTLLEETDLSLSEISNRLGYQYTSNFSAAFKRELGFSPSSVRKNQE